MEEKFVPFDLAVKLKELGFDQPCFCIWNREKSLRFNNLYNPDDRNKSGRLTNNNGKYPAPLWQQAFDFFREKHEMLCVISRGYGYEYLICEDNHHKKEIAGDGTYNTYEEARLACLQKLIKIAESWNTQKK